MINNIFNLAGFSTYLQSVTKGIVIIIAVVIGSKQISSNSN